MQTLPSETLEALKRDYRRMREEMRSHYNPMGLMVVPAGILKQLLLMTRWRDKNAGIHPQDPAYDDDYDAEADYDAYLDACEQREEMRREEGW